jgi:hypothetical protein
VQKYNDIQIHLTKVLFSALLVTGLQMTCAENTATTGTVDTPIGKIDLLMGLPANAQVEKKIYDEMDFQRACQAYIWATPIVAMNEWRACAPGRDWSKTWRFGPVQQLQRQARHSHSQLHNTLHHHVRYGMTFLMISTRA